MIRKSTVIAAALALCALAGCSTPKARFYALSAPGQPASKALYSVAVGPVSVPEAVDRPQLVLRNAGNEVTIAEQTRWAGPLKSEVPRVLAANLAQALGDAYVSAYPQSTVSGADYVVVVDIQRFESAPGEAATIEALWAVRAAKGKDGAPRNGRSVVREPAQGKDDDALVAAHSRALMSISRDIAEAVRAARATR